MRQIGFGRPHGQRYGKCSRLRFLYRANTLLETWRSLGNGGVAVHHSGS